MSGAAAEEWSSSGGPTSINSIAEMLKEGNWTLQGCNSAATTARCGHAASSRIKHRAHSPRRFRRTATFYDVRNALGRWRIGQRPHASRCGGCMMTMSLMSLCD